MVHEYEVTLNVQICKLLLYTGKNVSLLHLVETILPTFYEQRGEAAMGSSIFAGVANLYLEYIAGSQVSTLQTLSVEVV